MAMAGFSFRCQTAGVRGRERDTHLDGSPSRSRAPRGARAYGKVPKNRGKNLTLIASMSLYGMGESMCIEGATDAKAFEPKPSSYTLSTFWLLRFVRGRWW